MAHRCEADGAVHPPERLMLMQGRVEEADRMLAPSCRGFPRRTEPTLRQGAAGTEESIPDR